MKKLCLVILCFGALASSNASLMQMVASFDGLPVADGGLGQAFPFGGTFSYVYDDSLIPTTGSFEITDVAPTTLFLDHPTVGSTTFDISNTYVRLDFSDSLLVGVTLGDRGDVGGAGAGRDDFTVLIYGTDSNAFRAIFYSLAGDSNTFATDFNPTGTYSTSSVPDTSSTAGMLGVALFALALAKTPAVMRRRTAKFSATSV